MEEKLKSRKRLQGIVTNIIDDNTVKIRVETKSAHPMYGKIMKSHKTYLVHNTKFVKEDGIDIEVGEEVVVEECKPISKKKSFILIDKIVRK
ncbi:30S ribosomal protein S17 [Candidatus Dojkabacteria bacterium]|nr:30S ribosomal protein S17 [Candidatus Dojkabacteria bacterium]